MKNNNVIEPIAAEGIETVTQEGDKTTERVKPYTFRSLKADDTFLMLKIIKKIGLKELKTAFDPETVKELMNGFAGEEGGAGKAIASVGLNVTLEIADILLGNLAECREEIYQLLANTSDLTYEDVQNLDFADFFEMVVDFIKKEEFKDFFKRVAKLIGLEI